MPTRRRLMLTAGDIEVFHWLWMLRAMTLEQIRRVRYYQPETGRLSAADNVRKRLKRLWDDGYLVGDRLMETNERVYFLGKEALPYLREALGIEQRRLYTPKGSETMLLHPLLVSECSVRIVEALRGSSMHLLDLEPLHVPFYHTHAIGDPRAKKHVKRFVTQEDIRVPGYPEPLRIRPDLAFGLGQDDASRLYFLEADRGFESAQEIALKLLGYHHYAQTPDTKQPERLLWQRYGALRDMRVLLLTTDERRVEKLREHLSSRPGFELLALSSLETMAGQSFVFDGVWTTASGSGNPLVASEHA